MKLTKSKKQSLHLQKLVFEALEGGKNPPIRGSDTLAVLLDVPHSEVKKAIKENGSIGWSEVGDKLMAWRS